MDKKAIAGSSFENESDGHAGPSDRQIRFVDSQTLEPRPDVDAGQILLSSKPLNWDGIYLETGENKSFNPDDATLVQHYFAMNIGPAYEWEWKDGRQFKSHRYETGDIWVNPAHVPFTHRVNTYNRFALLALEPKKLVESLPDFPLIERQQFRREHKAQDLHLQTLMRSLLVEAQTGGPNGRLYTDSLATALAVHFVNHYSIGNQPNFQKHFQQASIADRQRLRRVVDYIEASLKEDIGLSDLALVAGLSKFHFSRLFKTAFGFTPYQYLMKRKIERAAYELSKRATSVAQVAAEYGFTDQAQFTRNFKKVKGLAPKAFVNQTR